MLYCCLSAAEAGSNVYVQSPLHWQLGTTALSTATHSTHAGTPLLILFSELLSLCLCSWSRCWDGLIIISKSDHRSNNYLTLSFKWNLKHCCFCKRFTYATFCTTPGHNFVVFFVVFILLVFSDFVDRICSFLWHCLMNTGFREHFVCLYECDCVYVSVSMYVRMYAYLLV